ncbi:MAG TPA: hypothetical protein VM285_04735, partial [Polyangia bacterium]|nr:hypothetical protein [Polyangia bacterium]
VETDDGYLHVAQFLVDGQNTNAYKGDAALLYVPAVDQRRALYIFTTGQGFSSNHAVISAPVNTPLMINTWDVSQVCDGPLSDGSLILEDVEYDFESWECQIPDGAHMVHSGATPEEATVPIGVFVYGYYNAGSYSYPAGSDLRRINPVVVE